MNQRDLRRKHSERGVALLTSLGVLFVVAALGTAYLGYMITESQRTRFNVDQLRLRGIAEGGVYAALADLAAHPGDAAQEAERSYQFEFPVYVYQSGEEAGLAQDEGLVGRTRVTVMRAAQFEPYARLLRQLGEPGDAAALHLMSTAELVEHLPGVEAAGERILGRKRIDAVVALDSSGTPTIRYWSEGGAR